MTVARLAALVLTALLLGITFCHVLEMGPKLSYDSGLYMTLQMTLYGHFGPPGVGGFIEPGAILAVAAVAVLARRRRRVGFAFTVAAGVCLLIAFPVIYFAFTEPVNDTFREALVSGDVPVEWQRLRLVWELSHAARFALHLAAFCLLALSVLKETRYSASSPMFGEGPPSMTMVAPFMNDEASEARNTQG
jgi:hypothetical protein